ncbi:hypothetical protein Bca52824_082448 [Brassica carinata]|uniref:Uncharacterized protein n=1 Tax=Brassica carinata TaxID=52824 RepID=A0A8X7PKF8_BRACI|nr:hypothetical protein Bca52824_082448 [Brassica carinata]
MQSDLLTPRPPRERVVPPSEETTLDDGSNPELRQGTKGTKNEIDMLIQEKQKKLKQGGLPKSSSVGMARIDEEEEAEEGSEPERERVRRSA